MSTTTSSKQQQQKKNTSSGAASTNNNDAGKVSNSHKCQSMDEFISKTEALFNQFPSTSRYVMKFNNKKGKMSLKTTTNDTYVVKYSTDQASDLQLLERINNFVMTVTTEKNEELKK